MKFLKKYGKRILVWLLIFAAFGVFAHWQNNDLLLTKYEYFDKELPAAFDGYRILQVSDLHNKLFDKNQTPLVELTREAAPDIIVITGDMIDGNHPHVDPAIRYAEQAVDIAPVYYITGNHELFAAAETTELLTRLRACGVQVLETEEVVLARGGEKISLLGFDSSYAVNGLQKKLVQDARCDYRIVLMHNPLLFPKLSELDVNLALAGHIHGGQVRLPVIGGLYGPEQGILPEYDDGMYTENDTTMIISRGVGNSGFPVRVFNRPELVLVTLRTDA